MESRHNEASRPWTGLIVVYAILLIIAFFLGYMLRKRQDDATMKQAASLAAMATRMVEEMKVANKNEPNVGPVRVVNGRGM